MLYLRLPGTSPGNLFTGDPMPPISDILGPLLGFLFTAGTLIFIGTTARWTADREDLTGLDLPPTPPAPKAVAMNSPGAEPPAGPL
jgi:hypothetical protein